ncbi:DUF5677 domain-containing protein [Fibrivirga algicola]|uniref:Uncharacterized protein n=1 Tax=Fibrivirga algicola TaxID=2950420 RepID=A0ABX0QBE5_9BACT|nr:DUF5677 domain-containing protein [Fibrivirga algicola]NID09655.1 hypothetical protein [Fibrivirga algicola]
MYKAVEDIIPRTLDPNVEDLVKKLSRIIDNFVDFGTNILKWDIDVKRVEEFNAPIMMTYRHFLELADSTAILIGKSSIDPCKLLLRGMLESYFSLAYMLEADTEDRCMAFMVWTMHKKIKALERGDPDSAIGKHFKSKLSKDKLASSLQLQTFPELQVEKARLESVFQKPHYQKAEREYQLLKTAGTANPAWYRLFNGPKDMERMADHLNLMVMYDVFYRDWSGPIHSTDIFQGKVSVAQDGTSEIHQLRTPQNIQAVSQWVLTLSLMMFELYVDKRISNKKSDFLNWYKTIREPYLRICSKDPLIHLS